MRYFAILLIVWLAVIVGIKEASADNVYRLNEKTVVIHKCSDSKLENPQQIKKLKLGDHKVILYLVACRIT